MADMNSISNALVNGDDKAVIRLVKGAIDEGAEAKTVLNEGLMTAMDIIGDRMESGEMFIPEVLNAAQIMSEAVDILKPNLASDDLTGIGKVVIGTVKGDMHDIGKNLVSLVLESTGYETTDLGIDVAPEKFIEAVKEKNADIVALSSLLTTTMGMMTETVAKIKEAGLQDQVKVIVGGAPVTQAFADEIGADGYALDAISAKKLVKQLMTQ